MKKIWIIVLLAVFGSSIFAQVNLVPNQSFEDTVKCPSSASQIERAAGWSSYRGSPDYYNVCDTNPLFGVPTNFYGGYQQPATGDAYVGIVCCATSTFYREIFAIQLAAPLVVGQEYYCSFKTSMGVGGFDTIHNAGCNKLGFKFTMQSYDFLTNQIPIDNMSQVYNNSIITDTLNWNLVSGCFIADSAYQYVAIGVFFDDLSINIINFNSPLDGASYYFVDDVFVGTDSVACSNISSTDIINRAPNIKVFPNPFSEQINVLSKNIETFKARIYDQTGRLINTQSIYFGYNKINLSSLDVGIYNLFINEGKNKTSDYKYKLIKIKP